MLICKLENKVPFDRIIRPESFEDQVVALEFNTFSNLEYLRNLLMGNEISQEIIEELC